MPARRWNVGGINRRFRVVDFPHSMSAVAARALSHSSLALGQEPSMLAGPVLVELIDRQERLANLHVLDVTVAAAT
jgi:hypothetical protein